MSAHVYTPSQLLPGESNFLRQHCFTRWMSYELLEPAGDFLRNLRLIPVYVECSPDKEHRYLLWHPPVGCECEAHSGCTPPQFEEFDFQQIGRGRVLLSLHISDGNLYSAVWITPEHFKPASRFLSSYGITPASQLLMT